MTDIKEQAPELAAELTEDAIEAAEDIYDGVVETVEIVRNNPAMVITAAVMGAAVGGAVGYFVARKQLRAYYEDLATQEIAEARDFYAELNKVDKDGAVITPRKVLEDRHGAATAAEALRDYQGHTEEDISWNEDDERAERLQQKAAEKMEARRRDEEADRAKINVFNSPVFDLEEEKKYRTKEEPYVITQDEFNAGEREFDQSSLTYFEDDDVLVDERDMPIRDMESVIGEDNLVRFGHGSGDANLVYIRNERLELDYEVVKSTGSYVDEVLGLGEEPDNSSSNADRRRAFRNGDG